ncbi:unnamed protein product [Meloidogyne enterolobii]|uniref:Uncharacterized protein n=1 Tax=Meloidogyne enterolobii TaxID=390850 RepID=A0ACB0Y0V0_MELEN
MVKLRPTSTHFSVRNLGNYLRGPVIGINFGFTNSSVSILEDRKAKVLKNDEDAFTTPSVVAFTEDGEYLVGAPAVRQAVLNSQNTIFGIKRLIGLKYEDKQVQDFMKTIPYKIVKSFNGDACIEIQSKLYSPSQIVSFILLKLKQTAENYLNKKIRETIITIPGYFNDSQKQALEEAGKLAGMKILRFVDDSATAAAIDCDYGRGSREIAVCNLNGGIFEFSILRVQDEAYEILSTNHNPLLSGDAFNNTIVNYFVSEFERENGIDLSKDPVAIQRLRKASEKAKCRLSSCTQTEIILPNIFVDTNGPPKHFRIKLTRSKFEELTENLIQKIEQLAQRTLNDAKMANQADDKDLQLNEEEDLQSTGVTSVLTIGGMSKVPKVFF